MSLPKLVFNKLYDLLLSFEMKPVAANCGGKVQLMGVVPGPLQALTVRREAFHAAPLFWARGLAQRRPNQSPASTAAPALVDRRDIQWLWSQLCVQLCLMVCVSLVSENSHSTCLSSLHSTLGHLSLLLRKRPQPRS